MDHETDVVISLIARIREKANRLITAELAARELHGLKPIHGDLLLALFTRDQPTMKELADLVDLAGVTVMPGNVNAHDHLYATLIGGMPLPDRPLESFTDILTEIWWPLDRALDADAVRISALAGAWDAVRSGTTIIFDNHSSLSYVRGSLDEVERAIETVGLRANLCYEVTDRGGKGLRDTALEETERYLARRQETPDGCVAQFRTMVGAHASFTLEDRTLGFLAQLCDRYGSPTHLHVGESPEDREICRTRGWADPVDRLMAAGLIREGSVLAHGVDLNEGELARVDQAGA